MEFFLDLRFEDSGYNASVHLATTIVVEDEVEAKLFSSELVAAFERKSVSLIYQSCRRIDNNAEDKERAYEYHNNYLARATAKIEVEQFIIENPNQNKSLIDNMVEKIFTGENSTAVFRKKYNVPVNVRDKKTGEAITDEFYYFSVEHLIPKK